MEDILNIAQLVVAIALIIVILVQNKGAGLGGVFGGDGNTYSTKRGFEKNLHTITIVLAALFLGLALANFFI
ncbi:preprotein translocase subunit SecG [Patescibacteria group bacterium]|nr:preprotein translocase subunit SecG [Patescibacteria group bacterium]MBU1952517.1 preprotein translocase subunit SecG [Patescibacteria group bacterium]MBU2229101.1 preprotein translocase subunit SecG [Patescibacteria group bacterium]